MRISDWSSDVCSSDLCLAALRPLHPHRIPLPPSPAGVLGRPCSGRWHGHRRTGDLKGVRTMTHQTRESWLNEVAQGMAPLFEALDAPLPDRVRVAIGFTSRGAKAKAIGECWDNRLSADGHFEIFIRPDLAHEPDAMPAQIAAILAHELVHAAVGIPAGHGKAFKRAALGLGLVGPRRAPRSEERRVGTECGSTWGAR